MVDSDLKQTVAVIAQATEANERQIREVARNAAESFKEVSQLIEKSNIATNSKLEALSLSTNTKLENIGATFQASQKPNYMLWLAAIAVFFTLISAGWKITDLQTKVTMAPIATQAFQNDAAITGLRDSDILQRNDLAKLRADIDANTARDEVSERDRQKLNERATKAEERDAELVTKYEITAARLVEVETQFRASDQSHNVQFAEAQRMNNIILQIAQKKPVIDYPLNPYFFPSIAPNGH